MGKEEKELIIMVMGALSLILALLLLWSIN